MKKITLLLSIFFLIMSGIQAQGVFVSQQCDPKENFRADRFAEIYNSSDVTVDLSGWTVQCVQNGSVSFSWSLSGSIASGEALVCGFNKTGQTITPDFLSSSSNTSWNGGANDGSILRNASGDTIDFAVGLLFTDKQMVRNSSVTSPSYSFNSSEWTVSSVDDAVDATPGTHDCDLPISNAPTIANFRPEAGTEVTVGSSFNVSAIVTTTTGSIDSVRFAYGSEFSNLTDTVKMTDAEVQDSFYYSMTIDDIGTYYVQVIAYGSNGTKKASSVHSVIVECGTVIAPTATDATNIESTSFTANWDAVTEADHYLLSVWKVVDGTEMVTNGGFENGSSDWTKFETEYEIVGASEMTPYSGDSCIKCFATAIRDLAQDITFTADGASEYEISLWYKYSSTAAAKKLRIYAEFTTGSYTGDNLKPSYYDAVDIWTNVKYTITPSAGSNVLHLEFRTYSSGEIYMDDISVKQVSDYTLADSDVGDVTTKEVTNLDASTTYYYTVQTVDQYGCTSDVSNEIAATTGVATLEKEIIVNDYNVFVSDKNIVIETEAEQAVCIYDMTGRTIVNQVVNSRSEFTVQCGIYIVRVDDVVTKVAVE